VGAGHALARRAIGRQFGGTFSSVIGPTKVFPAAEDRIPCDPGWLFEIRSTELKRPQILFEIPGLGLEKMMGKTYDYVIVGAGSAGCVLAGRLSEDPSLRVCLLEAGPPDRSIFIHMPAGYDYLMQNPRYNWRYRSEPAPGLDGRSTDILSTRAWPGRLVVHQRPGVSPWPSLGLRGLGG
jgi:hypothetical protein